MTITYAVTYEFPTRARVGLLTASCAGDMMATIKSGEAAARRDLRVRLVVERLTGVSQEDGFINAAMQRGIDKEADAFEGPDDRSLPQTFIFRDKDGNETKRRSE